MKHIYNIFQAYIYTFPELMINQPNNLLEKLKILIERILTLKRSSACFCIFSTTLPGLALKYMTASS